MDGDEFWGTYESLAQEASQKAHHIAMLVLQDDTSGIDAGLRLDYAYAVRTFLGFLADNNFTDHEHAFIHTESNGPVSIETDPEEGVFRVYRFDRVELDPADVTPDDGKRIHAAYGRMTSA